MQRLHKLDQLLYRSQQKACGNNASGAARLCARLPWADRSFGSQAAVLGDRSSGLQIASLLRQHRRQIREGCCLQAYHLLLDA